MRRLSLLGSLLPVILWGCSSSEAPSAPSGNAGNASGGSGGSSSAGAAGSAVGGGGAAAGSPNTGGGAGGSAGVASTAGAAGTAGASGAAGAGGGSGGTAGFCAARAGLTFCEDFEKHTVGAAKAVGPWSTSVNGDGATIEIDGTVAHSGKSSLKVRAGGFNAFYTLNVATAMASVPGALYLRAYVRITEPMEGGHNTYIVADTIAAPGQGNAYKIGEMNAMLMYNVGGDAQAALANNNYYTDHKPGAALKAGEWGCLEVTLDHAKPEIAVALDGVAIPDMHHTDFDMDAYDALRFGFEKYAGPMRDIWYDDIAIGTAPLGCK